VEPEFILVSCSGAARPGLDATDVTRIVAAKRRGEDLLRSTGLGYTVIRPGPLVVGRAVLVLLLLLFLLLLVFASGLATHSKQAVLLWFCRTCLSLIAEYMVHALPLFMLVRLGQTLTLFAAVLLAG
jgi:hypothetical protein